MKNFLAHDFVWIDKAQSLEGVLEDWVKDVWSISLPLVVRRDKDARNNRIPVGIRGKERHQRCALWIASEHVVRKMTPCEVVGFLEETNFSLPPIYAAREFKKRIWPFEWGITGSCAYSLVVKDCVMRKTSDLDLVVRSFKELSRSDFKDWISLSENCPCRVDTQIDTGFGAFSLKEWVLSETVLLKTNTGPCLVRNPWEN